MLPKQRLRFRVEDTLLLLQEVSHENPYRNKEKWEVIRNRLVAATQKNFSIRGVRDHVEYILKIWIKERNLNKSGIEEYSERDQLLEQIQELRNEFELKTRKSRLQQLSMEAKYITPENVNSFGINEVEPEVLTPASSCATDSQSLNPIFLSRPVSSQQDIPLINSTPGPSIRVLSPLEISLPEVSTVPSLSPSELPSTSTIGPIRNRNNRTTTIVRNPTLRYFEERIKAETQFQKETLKFKKEKFQFEKEKLKLEEAKFKLEEEKFKLEKEERITRLQLEAKERKNSIDAVNQQRQLMKMLLHLINKSNIST